MGVHFRRESLAGVTDLVLHTLERSRWERATQQRGRTSRQRTGRDSDRERTDNEGERRDSEREGEGTDGEGEGGWGDEREGAGVCLNRRGGGTTTEGYTGHSLLRDFLFCEGSPCSFPSLPLNHMAVAALAAPKVQSTCLSPIPNLHSRPLSSLCTRPN